MTETLGINWILKLSNLIAGKSSKTFLSDPISVTFNKVSHTWQVGYEKTCDPGTETVHIRPFLVWLKTNSNHSEITAKCSAQFSSDLRNGMEKFWFTTKLEEKVYFDDTTTGFDLKVGNLIVLRFRDLPIFTSR